MPGSGTSVVGNIVGYLRLDPSDWNTELDKAAAKADDLGRHDPNVKVSVDAAAAISKLEAVEVAMRRLQDAEGRVSVAQAKLSDLQAKGGAPAGKLRAAEEALAKAQRGQEVAALRLATANRKSAEAQDHSADSSRIARQGMSGLLTTALLLGPALVPIAAGAVGVAGAMGGMGVAAVLAVKGITAEMAAGTAEGKKYTAGIHTLQGDLSALEATAAHGILNAFEQAVHDINGQMPFLNGMVDRFTGILGRTGGNFLTGVISALHTLEPLLFDGAMAVEHFSAQFAQAAAGDGLKSFTSYAITSLPQVMDLLDSLIQAAGHLLAAFAPIGSVVIGILTALADAISAIPVPVLSALAAAALGLFAAFKGYQVISDASDALKVMKADLGGLAAKMGIAASGGALLSGAVAGVTAVLGIAAFVWAKHEQAVAQARQAADDYAAALAKTHGAIDQSIRDMTAKRLADEGALEVARQYGITLEDVTTAALYPNSAAHKRVAAAIQEHGSSLQSMNRAQVESGTQSRVYTNDAKKLQGAIGDTNTALKDGAQKQRDIAAASKVATSELSAQEQQQRRLAGTYGVSVGTYQAATEATKQQAQASAQAKVQMLLEGNAGQYLKTILDELSGKSLSAAQAQNAFQQQLINMRTAAAKGHTALTGMSAAAVTNRGNLLQLVQGAEASASAYGDQTHSAEKARLKLISLRQTLIDNAVAAGMNRGEVTKLIDSVLHIPSKAKTDISVPGADKSARQVDTVSNKVKSLPWYRPVKIAITGNAVGQVGQVQAAINALRGRSVPISVYQQNAFNKMAGMAGHSATGGTVGGGGSPTSDSVPMWLSRTEEVISNASGQADHWRPVLKAINAGASDSEVASMVSSAAPGASTTTLAGRHFTDADIHALAAAMSRVQLSLDGRAVSKSVSRELVRRL